MRINDVKWLSAFEVVSSVEWYSLSSLLNIFKVCVNDSGLVRIYDRRDPRKASFVGSSSGNALRSIAVNPLRVMSCI
jgi:hypothetical protein